MMKTIPLILLALLGASANANAYQADQAGNPSGKVWINCERPESKCPPPPPPPAPPVPPAPVEGFVPPAPPPPPAPPALPDVPEQAHAACAGKASGSALTWSLGQGDTMTGVCESASGRMRFRLQGHHKSP